MVLHCSGIAQADLKGRCHWLNVHIIWARLFVEFGLQTYRVASIADVLRSGTNAHHTITMVDPGCK
eukprot:COSAG02_NODE_49388_length_327_cov_0.679825_1_plen_65_part_10